MAQDFILREGWGVAKQKREGIQVQEEGTCGLKGKKLGPALTVCVKGVWESPDFSS